MHIIISALPPFPLAGEDFVGTNLTLEFLPGERRKTVTLSILDDLLLDDGEMFNVILTTPDPEVTTARDNVTVTILDVDCK